LFEYYERFFSLLVWTFCCANYGFVAFRHDTIWDPKRADEAEKRGEDIEGFLSGQHELVKKQCLMELLHMSDYDVETAQREYSRIVKFGGEPSSKMDLQEGRKFERLLKTKKKDFNTLARKMQRNPSDCMVYYYNWKRTRATYSSMKAEWKSDYCAICDDGGDLIVCDKCHRPYHMECLDPPVKRIPQGEWHCPRCKAPTPQVDGDRPRRGGTGYQPRQPFSPFSPSRASNKSSVVPSVAPVASSPYSDSIRSATVPSMAPSPAITRREVRAL
jgi:hypothetical protein